MPRGTWQSALTRSNTECWRPSPNCLPFHALPGAEGRRPAKDQKVLFEWLEKGRVEGRLEAERELVRRLVAGRFGDAAAEDFVAVLADISDSDRLAAIAAGVFTCETVVELVKLAHGDTTPPERA